MPFRRIIYQSQNPAGQPQPFPRGLRSHGPCLPIQIEIHPTLATQLQQTSQAVPSPVSGMALIDTGASISGVDQTVLGQLGVNPVGIIDVGTANGVVQQALYPARFIFPGAPVLSFNFDAVIGVNLSGQTPRGSAASLIALIGRDILEEVLMIYDGLSGSVILSY